MNDIASRNWDLERAQIAELFRAVGRLPSLGDCRQIDITGPIYISPCTRLFLGRLPNFAEKILIKWCVLDNSDEPDVVYARKQYDGLVGLNASKTGGEKFNLVRPYHLFEDRAIIVQSWIEGKSLADAISDRAWPIARLKELFGAAGQWLAHFHEFSINAEPSAVTRGLFDGVETEAIALGRRGRRIAHIVWHLAQSDVFEGSLLQRTAGLHCDFKPANLIATPSGIFAIDFQSSKPAGVYFDLAHFLNAATIDAAKTWRLALNLRMPSLGRAFVSGYASAIGPIDPLVLAMYRVYDLSRYMLQHGGTNSARIMGTIKWWVLERLLEARFREFQSLRRERADLR